MSAHVLLNFLIKQGKSDRMRGMVMVDFLKFKTQVACQNSLDKYGRAKGISDNMPPLYVSPQFAFLRAICEFQHMY